MRQPSSRPITLFSILLLGALACDEQTTQVFSDSAVPDQAVDTQPAPDLLVPDLVPPDMPLPTCSDQTKNGQETDVDCGGATCPACADNKQCNKPSDCLSGVCSAGKAAGTN